MPQLRNQILRTTLKGDAESESVTVTESDIFIPIHTHDHSSLSGRLDPKSHPQYMTEEGAADLFRALLQQYILTGQLGTIRNAQNLGTGQGVFAAVNNGVLQFYSLEAGDNVTISQTGNTIRIDSTGGGGGGIVFTFDAFDGIPNILGSPFVLPPVEGSLIELGATIGTFSFTTVTFSETPDFTELTDPDGSVFDPVIDFGAPLAASMPFVYNASTFQVTGEANIVLPTAIKTFTMAGTKNTTTQNRTKSVQWTGRLYYGKGAPSGLTGNVPNFHTPVVSQPASQTYAAIISALTGSSLSATKSKTFNVTTGINEKIYFAYPTLYGSIANFLVGAFPDGFFKIADDIVITNQFGENITYTLYESDEDNLGDCTVVVT